MANYVIKYKYQRLNYYEIGILDGNGVAKGVYMCPASQGFNI